MGFDMKFMKAALKEARKAEEKGECPIGAVIVKEGKIISRGHNLRETKQSPLAHAELIAIRKASKKLKSWRLVDCDLYVTLEPCPMCAGAIIQGRIEHVYFGAFDPKAGAAGSVTNLFLAGMFNHDVEVRGNVMGEACAAILSDFFRQLRAKKKGKHPANSEEL